MEMRTDMERSSRGNLSRTAIFRALGEGIAGFALGCTEPLRGCSPFGIAFCAGAMPGTGGFCCLLGTISGYLLSRGLDRGVRYASASMLSFTTAFVFRDTPAMERKWFLPLASGLITLICGTLAYFEGSAPLLTTARLCAEVLLSLLCCRPFALLRRKKGELTQEEQGLRTRGLVLLYGCLVTALCRLSVFGLFPLGWIPAVLTTLLWAWAGGSLKGAAAGLVMGLCGELSTGVESPLALCCSLGGLLGGAVKAKGRLPFAAAFLPGFALPLLAREQPALTSLWAVGLALPAFLLLPREKLNSLSERLVPWEGKSGEGLLRGYAAARTGELADCLRELYESFSERREEETEEDMSTVYDRAAECVCGGCLRKELCWHAEYLSMLSGLSDVTEVVQRRGRLSMQELPRRFRESCVHPEAFLQAVNGEIRTRNYRRMLRARLEDNRMAALGQLRTLSAVLAEQKRELGEEQRPEPALERSVNRYLHARGLEAQASVFRDERRRIRILLEGERLLGLSEHERLLNELSELTGVRLCRLRTNPAERERMILAEREHYSASVGIATERKMGESVSGDRGTWFSVEQGFLYLLLSDGMGSGADAAREAVSTVRGLERLLCAGVAAEESLKLMNGLMLLRNGENWDYATIDLLRVDLFSGETSFFKFGAAPSYVYSEGEVKRVRGVSLAAGILSGENEERELPRTILSAGDRVVLCSDGVASEQNDGWIRELLEQHRGESKTLAETLVGEAVRRYGRCDDMTVLVLQLRENET